MQPSTFNGKSKFKDFKKIKQEHDIKSSKGGRIIMVAPFYTNISKLNDGSLIYHKCWVIWSLFATLNYQNDIKMPKDMIVKKIHKLYFEPM